MTPKDKSTDRSSPGDDAEDAPKTLEERIDEGNEESFPASDPPAVHDPSKVR